mmetsp:Transcript_41162/g.47456  ORF Transcript_41162/g.47456 Transcript_41162/m.47456 type:complete len:141 (+) Transcript_41162:57-479(+)
MSGPDIDISSSRKDTLVDRYLFARHYATSRFDLAIKKGLKDFSLCGYRCFEKEKHNYGDALKCTVQCQERTENLEAMIDEQLELIDYDLDDCLDNIDYNRSQALSDVKIQECYEKIIVRFENDFTDAVVDDIVQKSGIVL